MVATVGEVRGRIVVRSFSTGSLGAIMAGKVSGRIVACNSYNLRSRRVKGKLHINNKVLEEAILSDIKQIILRDFKMMDFNNKEEIQGSIRDRKIRWQTNINRSSLRITNNKGNKLLM